MKRLLPLVALATSAVSAQCPDWLDVDKRLLHSKDTVNLCQLTEDKPVLIVNTASHCGFTPQFEQLEALHKQYAPEGLVIIGVPSNNFFQAADDEEEAAEVCYKNYGVSFTMLTETEVRGGDADPIFVELAEQGASPKWNFYKYLVGKDGNLVDYWGSKTKPDDAKITGAIEAALR
ncbi:glutathione peroxidase [Ferrimonas lipolytica]|uniref:Glutathione peroxidase n=1 Tax=Ferrimonas lipolytica TaxID=2724191 RepID=A0A6H1U9Z8_9GAMM|nr:glutathione peroxidase [Ferrimonas lipolytica]QIZ75648.1 glutathione peroxidase [Ferrimonas lipolytica]